MVLAVTAACSGVARASCLAARCALGRVNRRRVALARHRLGGGLALLLRSSYHTLHRQTASSLPHTGLVHLSHAQSQSQSHHGRRQRQGMLSGPITRRCDGLARQFLGGLVLLLRSSYHTHHR